MFNLNYLFSGSSKFRLTGVGRVRRSSSDSTQSLLRAVPTLRGASSPGSVLCPGPPRRVGPLAGAKGDVVRPRAVNTLPVSRGALPPFIGYVCRRRRLGAQLCGLAVRWGRLSLFEIYLPVVGF